MTIRSSLGSSLGWHNVKMENMAATGHKVILYSDGGFLNQIGEVAKDDFCYVARTNVSAPDFDPAKDTFRADGYSRQ
jgi:hypothetical protein